MANEYTRRRNATISGGINPQPLVYNGIGEKLANTFGNTINSLNEAREKVSEKETIIDDAFSKYIVHENERPYVDSLKRKVSEEIDKNPFNVAYANKLAAKYANDPGLIARAKYYADYRQGEQRLDKLVNDGFISSQTKRMLLNKRNGANRYNYQDIYKNGNPEEGIEKGTEYEYTAPVKDMDWTELFGSIAKMHGINSTQTDTRKSFDKDGTGSSKQTGSSYRGLTKEQIDSGVKKLLKDDQWRKRVEQEIEVNEFNVIDLKEQLKTVTDPVIKSQLERQLKDAERWSAEWGASKHDIEAYCNKRLSDSQYNLSDIFAYSETTSKSYNDSTVKTDTPTGLSGTGLGGGGLSSQFGSTSNQTTLGNPVGKKYTFGFDSNKFLSSQSEQLFGGTGSGGSWK